MTDEKHCGDHSGNCTRIDRAEEDIQCIWRAIDGMRENVSALTVKIASIVGGVAVLSTAAQIAIAFWAASK